MKKLTLLLLAIGCISCAPKLTFEAQAIKNLCDDYVADSCILTLPKDTASTHSVKAAFGDKGIYFIASTPLSDPFIKIWINDGLRTRYSGDFSYVGQYESSYIYSFLYRQFPSMGLYEYNLMEWCTLYYCADANRRYAWSATFYPDSHNPNKEESFSYWFSKAVPYMLE